MSVDPITNNKPKNNPPLLIPASAFEITSDVVDMEVLNAFEELQSHDGSDLIVELIDLYLLDAAQRVKQIREASITTEWILLKSTAHNLKGSSGSLGVRKVAKICEKLEQLEGRDSLQRLAEIVQLLEYESSRASAALAAVRQRRLG